MHKNSKRKNLLSLFEKFISESKNGKRIQKNGKKISEGTIENYIATYKYLIKLNSNYNEPISINVKLKLNKKEFLIEKNYWLKFYKLFKELMYSKGCTDNYVGRTIKVLKVFFKYLELDKNIPSASFYKLFYATKYEPPIIVLDQEKLKFLITNKEFDSILPINLKSTKDVFIIGCTLGLRYSDLMTLKQKNIQKTQMGTYIVVVSRKTNTETRIKIPLYVEELLKKYSKKQSIIPKLTLTMFNHNIKKIGELAGWTYEVGKSISIQGKKKDQKNNKGKTYRFCDLLTSHVMRKTAITTMLLLGMPEPLVRKVSGHSPNSKEFYRYVKYTESFLDEETDKVFNKLLS